MNSPHWQQPKPLWQDGPASQGTVRLYHLPGDGRRAWLYLAATVVETGIYDLPGRLGGYPLLIALDGRLYKETLALPAMLDHLVATGQIPPLIALFVDTTNRQELRCDPAFADSMAHQVMPWLYEHFPVTHNPAQTVVIGSGDGGLAAVYLGLRHPQRFGKILSQTGWFHWRPEGDPNFHWLAHQYVQSPKLPLRFYLDVGNLAVVQMRDGGPTQLAANRHLRDVLLAQGYPVQYVESSGESSGGHDDSRLASPIFAALHHVFTEN